MSILTILAFASKSQPKVVTLTFTSSQTVTIPAGVTKLDTLVGKGQDGSGGGYESETFTIASVSKSSSQFGGTPENNQAVISDGVLEAEKFNQSSGERRVTYTSYTHRVGTDDLVQVTTASRVARIDGAASVSVRDGTGGAGGRITYNMATTPRVTVTALSLKNGTTGANTTGFARTFEGGSGVPATPVNLSNVAVTPGSYQLVIPTGGYITITYQQPA